MRLSFLKRDVLVCPRCTSEGKDDHLELFFRPSQTENDKVKSGLLTCESCSQSYPIYDGIAIFQGDQVAQKYGSKKVARTYILTQYRDVIAAKLRSALAGAGNDLTGYYAEADQENHYDRLAGLLATPINKESKGDRYWLCARIDPHGSVSPNHSFSEGIDAPVRKTSS